MKWLTDAWYQRKSWLILLSPLSFLYWLIITLRRFLYRSGIKKTFHLPVPVIVVGNLTVGGTGKTPAVIYLVQQLQQSGWRPGVISRGYGGALQDEVSTVTADSDPAICGDEPVLIFRRTQVPLVVAKRRVKAAQTLLAEFPHCNVIISDDGLQHYALSRTLEIVVIDGQRRFGNGWCLPAGPLREPLSRLKQVQFKICNGNPAQKDEYAMRLIAQQLQNLQDSNYSVDAAFFKQHTVHAIAGIGNPERFFTTLRQLGLTIIEHAFPDHHQFSLADFPADNLPVIMTEKDAVKCFAFAKQQFWFLPVAADIEPAFLSDLQAQL